MKLIPEHKLPMSYFDITTEINKQTGSPTKSENKIRNPRKKIRTAPVGNEADETTDTTVQTSKAKKKTITKNSSNVELPMSFREMDTDLILLIKVTHSIKTV